MENKDEENDNKSQSQSQSQSQPQSQSQLQPQVDVSNEAEEYAEVPPVKPPSVAYAISHNSNLVAAPSIVNTKTASERSRSNVTSPNKISIKAAEENEGNTQKVADQSLKEDLKASIVQVPSSGGGGGTSGEMGRGSTKGAVVTSGGGGGGGAFQGDNFLGMVSIPGATGLLQKRSPFIHNPPYPEERRARVQPPRSPIDYIINLREDLADFQESHGLPRTRDYSFVSLGLALAQETGRAILSVFQMFTELFPILAIVSLILRFALDKLIEILETTDTMAKIKKSIVFALEMLAIMIPLWILFGTIIIPLITLILSLFKRVLRIKGGKKKPVKPRPKIKPTTCSG